MDHLFKVAMNRRLTSARRLGDRPLRHALAGHQCHHRLACFTRQLQLPAQRVRDIRCPAWEAQRLMHLAGLGLVE